MTKKYALLSDRAPYSPIVGRPALRLPSGKKLAVWVIVNVEHWTIAGAMPRTVLPPPMGQTLLPDLANWSWHEYGMRVGFWRIFDALKQRGIRPTMAVNGIVCSSYRPIAEAAHKENWEFMGHGYLQGPMHRLEDQYREIEKTVTAIKEITGKGPVGWESPGLTETDTTLDYLSANGIRYLADWVIDDQPCWIEAEPQKMVSVPYTVELNDIPVFALQNHSSDEFYKRGVLQLERMVKDSQTSTRVMAISVHPYLTGVPHRIAAFEKFLDLVMQEKDAEIMTGEEIYRWFIGQ
ncbi:MAG: polysaccharide deacetylase [Betaproteobacteria bacterium]|nr:polysaccharide deacetylase [Betaproteobacteria bacterium]